MFSGAGVYRDDQIFALVIDGEVFLKSDDETEPRFRAAGSRPFSFDRKGKLVETSYFSLPADALDDGDVLKEWADLAYAAAQRAAQAKRPAPRKPRRRAAKGSARSRG